MRQCRPVTLPRASRHPGSAMRASAQPLHRLAALALTLCLMWLSAAGEAWTQGQAQPRLPAIPLAIGKHKVMAEVASDPQSRVVNRCHLYSLRILFFRLVIDRVPLLWAGTTDKKEYFFFLKRKRRGPVGTAPSFLIIRVEIGIDMGGTWFLTFIPS